MIEVQKYLKENPLSKLEEDFSIDINEYPDRVVLNYNQISSPKHHPITKECRGLILKKPDFNILCRSFDRFFNYGEDQKSKEFPIVKARTFEKLDGSLINVYHDGDKWQCATRKMAFAEGLLISIYGKMTYRDLFIEALGGDPNDVFQNLARDFTIIFELISPKNRIVTRYDKTICYLLDIRHRVSGEFLGIDMTKFWYIPKWVKWRYPMEFEFKDFDKIFNSMKTLPVLEEGYVTNYNGWRIKIKNPSYLAIAHLRENGVISERRVCQLVLDGEYQEYLSYFPEDTDIFMPYIEASLKMRAEILEFYDKYKDIEDQKEFALAIKDCKGKHILFQMRKNKDFNFEPIIDNMTKDAKVRLIKDYYV